MSRAELESVMDHLQRNLEDIEEMIEFDYNFTSAHISGHRVKKDEERIAEAEGQYLTGSAYLICQVCTVSFFVNRMVKTTFP